MSKFSQVTQILGHRGFTARAKENSIVAFRQALDVGASGVELDVWQCKSGEFVVSHDPAISNGRKIEDSLLSGLREAHAGEILLLDEVLDQLQHCVINVEVKSSTKNQDGDKARIAESLASLIESRSDSFDFILSTFDKDLAVKLSVVGGFAKPALLLGIRSRVDREIEFCIKNGLDLVHLNWRRASRRTISKLREADLGYSFWTVNRPEAILSLINVGAQYLITDKVALAVSITGH